MSRQAWLLGWCLVISVAASPGLGWASDGAEGIVRLDLAAGPAGVERVADLEPRILIGSDFFPWDGIADGGIGWQATVGQGEYVQAFDIFGTLIQVNVCTLGSMAGVDAAVAAVVYDDNGPGGTPGTLLAFSEPSVIPGLLNAISCYPLTVEAMALNGTVYLGARWRPVLDPNFFVATDLSATTAIQAMYARGGTPAAPGNWALLRATQPQIRALGIGARVVSMNQALAPCFDSMTRLCLNDSRFRTEIAWRRPNGNTGDGQDSGLRTDDAGIFYFFDPANLEMLVKVLNACGGAQPRYWVFFAATTNVEFSLVVTDTQRGVVKTYFNPLGRAAPPIQDTSAFATCP